MKNILLLICTLINFQTIAQTSLTGQVTDEETNEPILFGTVSLFKDGSLVTGTDTDLDGFYNFPNIDPGTYNVEVSYVGYQTVRLTGVAVYGGQTNKADVKLGTGGEIDLDIVKVIQYKIHLIEQYKTTTCGLNPERLRSLQLMQVGRIFNPSIPSPVIKLPARELKNTVQNMLDFHVY